MTTKKLENNRSKDHLEEVRENLIKDYKFKSQQEVDKSYSLEDVMAFESLELGTICSSQKLFLRAEYGKVTYNEDGSEDYTNSTAMTNYYFVTGNVKIYNEFIKYNEDDIIAREHVPRGESKIDKFFQIAKHYFTYSTHLHLLLKKKSKSSHVFLDNRKVVIEMHQRHRDTRKGKTKFTLELSQDEISDLIEQCISNKLNVLPQDLHYLLDEIDIEYDLSNIPKSKLIDRYKKNISNKNVANENEAYESMINNVNEFISSLKSILPNELSKSVGKKVNKIKTDMLDRL